MALPVSAEGRSAFSLYIISTSQPASESSLSPAELSFFRFSAVAAPPFSKVACLPSKVTLRLQLRAQSLLRALDALFNGGDAYAELRGCVRVALAEAEGAREQAQLRAARYMARKCPR